MKKIPYHIIAKLAVKHLTDDLSEQEVEVLQDWLNESERNKQLFSRLQNKNELQENLHLYNSIDEKRALERAREELEIPDLKVSSKKWIRYAAAILIPLSMVGGYYVFYNSNHRSATQESFAENTAMDSSNRAFVKLEDGSLVALNNKKKQVIAGDEYRLVKDTLNKLSYNLLSAEDQNAGLKSKKHSIITPRGGTYNLVLNDGSKVWLNAMSEITYPVVFDNDKRVVTVKGEVFFEITKDVSRPFVVSGNNSTVEVLGTQFNYRSYSDEIQDEITLEEGSIKVLGGENELVIQPGYQAIVSKDQSSVYVEKVNTKLFSSWKEGKMEFHRMTLERLTSNLARWYDVEFKYKDTELKNIQFSGGFEKTESIGFILNLIQETTNVKFTANDKLIIISQKEPAQP